MIRALAFIWAAELLLITAVPYRAKSILNTWRIRAFVWALFSIMEPLSIDLLFTLFALLYTLLYIVANSKSPEGSLLILISYLIILLGSFYYEPIRAISLPLLIIGVYRAFNSDYKFMWIEYVVSDSRSLVEIEEHDPSVVDSVPGRLRRVLHAINRIGTRAFNVAYEPPNGLLVSLVSLAYSFLPLLVSF